MTESAAPSQPALSKKSEEIITIDLKNPLIAGLLTWIFPGLGHFYQGRYFKCILFALCTTPTFFIGCYLGSSKDIGFARNVYWSWRPGDKRLFFIPQSCFGPAAVLAWVQSSRVNKGLEPVLNGAMAPPLLNAHNVPKDKRGWPPTLDEIIAKLGVYFEIGTIFTVVAGLMNLLIIFDAIDGPVMFRKPEESD
ncbi:MAG: DUF6677 family protein [Thermoguttaceae bacterium]